MTKNKTIIEINTATIVRGILLVLLLVGLYYIRDIVAIVLFSIVVASAVYPAANWFEKKRIPRVIAVLFIYLAVFAVLGLVFYLVIPTFISEVINFSSDFPEYLRNPSGLQSLISFLPISSDGSLASIVQEILSTFQSKIGSFASGFFRTTVNIFGGAVSFLLIIILSFYLSVQKSGLENFLRIVTPIEYESYVLNLWQRTRTKIGAWIKGQILLGILVGVLVFLGLTILRVKYALIFALLAAVFELIPIFGPILASVPVIVVAFAQSPTLALAVIVLYAIIQQFENHLIYPLVVRKIIGLPPILVILAIIIGAKLGGFFGVLLAIPAATALREFVSDVEAKKRPSA